MRFVSPQPQQTDPILSWLNRQQYTPNRGMVGDYNSYFMKNGSPAGGPGGGALLFDMYNQYLSANNQDWSLGAYRQWLDSLYQNGMFDGRGPTQNFYTDVMGYRQGPDGKIYNDYAVNRWMSPEQAQAQRESNPLYKPPPTPYTQTYKGQTIVGNSLAGLAYGKQSIDARQQPVATSKRPAMTGFGY